MKIIQVLLISTVALIPPTGFAGHDDSRVFGPGESSPVTQASAGQAWTAFFTHLRRAVRDRDRTTLRMLMITEFHYSYGQHASDRRDEAFRYWDDPQVGGWKALDVALAGGAVPKASWWRTGHEDQQRPGRIAPPAANVRRNVDRGLVPWMAQFEFREDGHWYFTAFDQCCD